LVNKFVLIGASGHIGRYLFECLSTNSQFELIALPSIRKLATNDLKALLPTSPAFVINAAGITPNSRERIDNSYVEANEILIQRIIQSLNPDIHSLVQISTTNISLINPSEYSDYEISKNNAETLIKESSSTSGMRSFIIRCPTVWDSNRIFSSRLYDLIRESINNYNSLLDVKVNDPDKQVKIVCSECFKIEITNILRNIEERDFLIDFQTNLWTGTISEFLLDIRLAKREQVYTNREIKHLSAILSKN
jgi:nucleoside-diphosphate-sugar epimerase